MYAMGGGGGGIQEDRKNDCLNFRSYLCFVVKAQI